MAYTDFIAAIDLGSSHMVGMVGTKGTTGTLSIIAYEVENSDACIRRGCVYNIKDAAVKIVRLIRKLENKLGGTRIGKVYIGVGGQSLRSINHVVSRVLGNAVVTEELLKELAQECQQYHPEMVEVLDVAPPVYYLDNQLEIQPVGLECSRIEARYKLLVGRPSLRHAATTNMTEQIKLDVAGAIVSPLALSDLILTDVEKQKGCALIDFGAGVTSVTMYKAGYLAGLFVIPLGSQLITRDLMTLGILEKEAERVKRTYGNAIWEKDNDQVMVPVDLADGQHTGEIKLSDINNIVDARCQELFANISARFKEAGLENDPGCCIVIAGGGINLNNMREALKEYFKMEVRYASVRKDRIEEGEMIANNPEYTTAAALLLRGTDNCAFYMEPEPVVETEKNVEKVVESDLVEPIEEEMKQEPDSESMNLTPPPITKVNEDKRRKKKSGGFFGELFEKVGKTIGEAIDEEDNRYKK